MRTTKSGIAFFESLNERRARMRAWKTKADAQAKALERELKKLDPHLEVDFIEPEAAKNHPRYRAPGVMPGRWHIIYRNRNTSGLDHYFPIAGPNREYRDPELAIVEEMKAQDLWKPGALKRIREGEEEERKRRRRQEIVESEARVEQVAAAYRAAKRVPGDGGATRRTDRKGKQEGVRDYAGGNSFQKSKGGVLLPAGVDE